MTVDLRRKARSEWVARAGIAVWIVLVAAAALNVFVIVVEGSKDTGFFVDRFFLPMICGFVAAGAVAVATSGLVIRGRTLVVVDIVTVTALAASQIFEIEDASGLTIVTRHGRRIQPYVCGRTLAKQLNHNMRLRISADAIRAWIMDDLEDDMVEPPPIRRVPRWSVILGVPAWAVFCGVLTVALHALV
jgi:hypothetical protein